MPAPTRPSAGSRQAAGFCLAASLVVVAGGAQAGSQPAAPALARVIHGHTVRSFDAAEGLKVGFLLSVVQAPDGRIWFGGEAGLQWYDGLRMRLVQPLGDRQGHASMFPRVSLLRPAADGSVSFNWGHDLMHMDRHGGIRMAARDGGGWAEPSTDPHHVSRLGAHAYWCAREDGSIVRLGQSPEFDLTVFDSTTGRSRAMPYQSPPQAVSDRMRCDGDWVYWLESDQITTAMAFNTTTGTQRRVEVPQMNSMRREESADWRDRLVVIDHRDVLISVAGRLMHVDFAAESLRPDAELTRDVRSGLDQNEIDNGLRIFDGPRKGLFWAAAAGSHALLVDSSRHSAPQKLDAGWMPGRRQPATPSKIRWIQDTEHEGRRTRWLLRGDWVQAVLLNEGLPAVSYAVHLDDTARASSDIDSLCETAQGDVWLVDANHRLVVMPSGAPYRLLSTPLKTVSWALHCSGDGSVWLFSEGDLYNAVPDGIGHYRYHRYRLPAIDTRWIGITAESDATLILARRNHLYRFSKKTGTVQELSAAGMPTSNVEVTPSPKAGPEGRRDMILLGNQNDIYTLRSGASEVQRLNYEPPLDSPATLGTLVWLSERRIAAVEVTGVVHLLSVSADGLSAQRSRLSDGRALEGRAVYCGARESDQAFWVSTTEGVARFETDSGQYTVLGSAGGVQWGDFNGPACSQQEATGHIWMGALDGWVRLKPADYPAPRSQYQALFNRATIGMRELEVGPAGLTLNETENLLRIEIGMRGNALVPSPSLLYRMEGIDSDWRHADPRQPIEYAGLAAGRYRLLARFSGPQHQALEAAQLHFTVQPPAYRSIAAQWAYGLFAVVFGTAWQVQRRGRLRERERQIAQVVESEARLSMALAASSSVMWDEISYHTLRTDAPWLGYDAEAISGDVEVFAQLIHPQDRPKYQEALQACREGQATQLHLEYRLRHREGHYLWVQDVGRVTAPGAGLDQPCRMTGTFHEITRVKTIEDELRVMATQDSLTGLPNRRECARLLDAALLGGPGGTSGVAVLFFDLDRFKLLNDSMGHAFGDRVLTQVAEGVQARLPLNATLCRLGGDEFVIILRDTHEADALRVGQSVLDAVCAMDQVGGVDVRISASVGIALHPQHSSDRKTLLQFADSAMYDAKTSGRGCVRLFDPQKAAGILERPHIESALSLGIERREFGMVYQPKVRLSDGRCVGFEALLRWRQEAFAHVRLGQVIDILETSGLIDSVGEWALTQACRDLAACTPAMAEGLGMAVNISALQLAKPGFPDRVAAILRATGVMPSQLELELTETVLAGTTASMLTQMEALRAMGVRVAIDDFGTGYSAMSYLLDLPVSTVKIDKSFVDRIDHELKAAQVCRSIIGLAQNIGLEVVAEGVERQAQLKALSKMNCPVVQGFLFSEPFEARLLPFWSAPEWHCAEAVH